MSRLTICPENQPDAPILDTRDGTEIAKALNAIGVRFERWSADVQLPPDASDEMILKAYEKDVKRLQEEDGYLSVDVIRVQKNNPDKEALRNKFLNEHTHDEDEVRFFIEGEGLFYLHVADKVYMTLCERGDLISVPAGTTHWFDMGAAPRYACIRLFENPDGWIAKFTGTDIADRFPKYEAADQAA